MYELIIKDEFSAAHNLREYRGKCEQLHGHNYGVELSIRYKTLNKTGIAVDFTVLKQLLRRVLAEYDHRHLNKLRDFAKLNPTAENIACVIHRKMKRKLTGIGGLKVCIWESAKTGACYYDAM